jgi:hypothetical protein
LNASGTSLRVEELKGLNQSHELMSETRCVLRVLRVIGQKRGPGPEWNDMTRISLILANGGAGE